MNAPNNDLAEIKRQTARLAEVARRSKGTQTAEEDESRRWYRACYDAGYISRQDLSGLIGVHELHELPDGFDE